MGKSLGHGAMGRVYAAEHIDLGRTCAVKVIRDRDQDVLLGVTSSAGPATYEDAVARFRVEALAASRLDHPNLLRVLDFGRDAEGLWFLVTEHLEGADLVDVLAAEGPLPTGRAVSIARQLCSGLAHAHERGVVHRDVKPENIRLFRSPSDDGGVIERVKLLDFGTAQIASGAADRDAEGGVVIGTPAYMSPEQASGEAVDRRADLYASGVVLFEMATGRLPFERATPIELAAAHVECRPPSPRSLRRDVDPELESIILWCLRKRRSERPQTARELRDALDRIAARSDPRRPRDVVSTLRSARAPAPEPARASRPPEPRRTTTRRERWAPSSDVGSGRRPEAPRRRSAPALLTFAAAAALGGSAWVLFGAAHAPGAAPPVAAAAPTAASRIDAPSAAPEPGAAADPRAPPRTEARAASAPQRPTDQAPEAVGGAAAMRSAAPPAREPGSDAAGAPSSGPASGRPPPGRARPSAPSSGSAADDDDPYSAFERPLPAVHDEPDAPTAPRPAEASGATPRAAGSADAGASEPGRPSAPGEASGEHAEAHAPDGGDLL